MEKFMKNFGNIVMIILEIVIGVVLLINPIDFLR